MQNLFPGVHVSSPSLLSFDQSIGLRAFLLRRESGNLLIYSTASLATEVPTVEELGGVARHHLGHWHEAGCGPWHAITDTADTRHRIDAIIDRPRRGDDH